MPQRPARPLVPALVLIALVFLTPALATAQPHGGEAALQAAERPQAGQSLFAKAWTLLSALWAENGSGLEPNGSTGASSGTGTPNAATTGDNGSGLEPDGRP
jgi:hypothetical protein